MRRVLQLLLAVIAAWLFCLGLSILVEGPEEPADAVLPPLAANVASVAPEAASQPEDGRDTALRRTDAAESARLTSTPAADGACVRVADRNGFPMGGRTYIRTVYQAFPPERLPT